MKLTESQLKQVIAEEIQQMVDEGFFSRMKGRVKGGLDTVKGKAKALAVGAGGKLAGIGDKAMGDQAAATAKQMSADASAQGRATKIKTLVADRVDELTTDLQKMGITLAKNSDVAKAIRYLHQALGREADASLGGAKLNKSRSAE